MTSHTGAYSFSPDKQSDAYDATMKDRDGQKMGRIMKANVCSANFGVVLVLVLPFLD